jgi:hypothetical protein
LTGSGFDQFSEAQLVRNYATDAVDELPTILQLIWPLFRKPKVGSVYRDELLSSTWSHPARHTPSAEEYFNSGFGCYFVTNSSDEIGKLDSGVFAGWSRTGQTFNVYPQGTSATPSICRFFIMAFAPKSSHFYTPSGSECATV